MICERVFGFLTPTPSGGNFGRQKTDFAARDIRKNSNGLWVITLWYKTEDSKKKSSWAV